MTGNTACVRFQRIINSALIKKIDVPVKGAVFSDDPNLFDNDKYG